MRVLAYTSPASGHLFPLVPTLGALRERGHEVTVLTLSTRCAAMRELGFDVHPVAASVEGIEQDDHAGRGVREKLRRSLDAFVRRAEYELPDMRAAIDAHRPDAVMCDANSWGAQAVAEASGLPHGLFIPYPVLLPSLEAPPFEHPRRDWPAGFRLVGPCAWEPPSEPPAWLAQDERPIVLVSTSSEYQGDGALVRTALAALADRSNLLVVATMPSADPGSIAVPPNARIERFQPHGPLLGARPRSSVTAEWA